MSREPEETFGSAVLKGAKFGALGGATLAAAGGSDVVFWTGMGTAAGVLHQGVKHIVKSVQATNDSVRAKKTVEARRAARQAASERRAYFAEGVNNSRD